MNYDRNPYAACDADRHALWERVVRQDIECFLRQDWQSYADCFTASTFTGLHANGVSDPARWTLAFPSVAAYQKAWLADAHRSAVTDYAESRRDALYRAVVHTEIALAGEQAIFRKIFDGNIKLTRGGCETLQWQSVFFCARTQGEWKMTGFVGYLPYPPAASAGATG